MSPPSLLALNDLAESDCALHGLRIKGEEETTEHMRLDFALKATLKVKGLGYGGCNCVKVRHKRYGHYAVAVYSRRGTGDWSDEASVPVSLWKRDGEPFRARSAVDRGFSQTAQAEKPAPP